MKKKYFRLFNKTIAISSFDTPNIPTLGVTNECEHSPSFRLFLDYDNADYEVVCKDIHFLQSNFSICNFIVITTGEEAWINEWDEQRTVGNYHVISCDTFPWHTINQIMELTRSDINHRRIASLRTTRSHVLRIIGKYDITPPGILNEFKPEPTLKDVFTFHPESCSRTHCKAQYRFLKAWFHIPHIPFPIHSFDNCRSMEYIHYSTLKHANPPNRKKPIARRGAIRV